MGIKRTVLIRQIDLWGSEPLESKKKMKKMQKTEMSNFPLYFWPNSFELIKCTALPGVTFKYSEKIPKPSWHIYTYNPSLGGHMDKKSELWHTLGTMSSL